MDRTRTALRTLLATGAVLGLTVTAAWASPRLPASSTTRPAAPEIFRSRPADASALSPSFPPGFTDTAVITGLSEPSAVRFADDGRVYVAEKSGLVLEYDSISDPTATVVKDLSSQVQDLGDRGLLGLALDPGFTTGRPFVYVLYTLDAPIGTPAPFYHDDCGPNPDDGNCIVGAHLSRFKIRTDGLGGREQVLIEGWCQQFSSHSIGTLQFGPDGALYAGGGDGASFYEADYGQFDNACADPPNEGGALRSQDLQTAADPTGLNGSILRVDPNTGAALPDNPLIGGDPTDDRTIAYGLRNPFRFTVKPGSDRVFIGDVGWNAWEELDRLGSAHDARVEDFGWPCYEGIGREPDYDALNLPICETLYGTPGAVTKPVSTFSHGGGCTHSNVVSGISFYEGPSYPAQYTGATFMGDVYDACMWSYLPKANGDPDPTTRAVFATGVDPVDIEMGPGGDLFWASWFGGSIHRITYTP